MKKNIAKIASVLFLGSFLVTACKSDKNGNTNTNSNTNSTTTAAPSTDS
ncbi:MAG: hypothetical protein ACX93T_02350 [Bacteroidota bacterium]